MSNDPVDKVLREERKEADKPAEVDLHQDRTHEIKAKAFARMRTDWNGDDAVVVASVIGIADNTILKKFAPAYAVMNELYEIVRDPVTDEIGTVLTDAHGFSFWKRNASDGFIEDYSRLTVKMRENLIFQITTNIMAWKQDAADMWGEAMLSKAQFEEAFADQFTSAPGARPTVDDRTQYARKNASDERYFAIYKSLVSRKADALVDSLELLGQRLKDRTA